MVVRKDYGNLITLHTKHTVMTGFMLSVQCLLCRLVSEFQFGGSESTSVLLSCLICWSAEVLSLCFHVNTAACLCSRLAGELH